jgi:hypothetical protein
MARGRGGWSKKLNPGPERTFREIIQEHQKLAYGIGELTPAEFGDLTPADFVPYINARIEREKEQIKMENERIGLICATLQNGIPAIMVKKGTDKHRPSDYFGKSTDEQPAKEDRESNMSKIYNTMMAWVGATKGGK